MAKNKYKKGQFVLYTARDGMGAIPGRVGVAEIARITNTGYDTKPFMFKCGIFKKSKTEAKWFLSLFEHDIICRVSKKNANDFHRVMTMTYTVYDKIVADLDSGLEKTQESLTQFCKDREKFLKGK